ncbi:hypothetical protein [Turicibacter sanguinis]
MYLLIGLGLCMLMLVLTVLLTLNAVHLEERFNKLRKHSSN